MNGNVLGSFHITRFSELNNLKIDMQNFIISFKVMGINIRQDYLRLSWNTADHPKRNFAKDILLYMN